jgi:tetratricopeptide (TPR) repeat protein
VQGVIVARIDRLDDDLKNVLKLASVIGRSFFLRVLQAIADAADAVVPGLGRLEETELIQLRQRAPEIEYMFKHALVQEAAYDSMLAERRRAIHGSVAQAIERLFPERSGDEFASLLAYHYACAQDWPKAQTFLLAAGDQAGRMAADVEALEHYRQAEATFMKVAARELTPLQRATMDRKLGQAFYGVGSYDEAFVHFTRALAHLGIRYPTTRLGVRLQIARYIAAHFLRRGLARWIKPTLAGDVALETSTICESLIWLNYLVDEERFALDGLIGLDVGDRSGDLDARGRGLAMLGIVLNAFGSHRWARRCVDEGISVAARANAPTTTAAAAFVRGFMQWTHGSVDEAWPSLEQSAAAYQAFGDLRGWAGAASVQFWLLAVRGQLVRAGSLGAEMVRTGEAANDPHLTSWGLGCVGYWGTAVGPLDEAALHVERGRSLCLQTSALRMQANFGGVLAKCLMRQGRIAKASEILHESVRVLEAMGLRDVYYIEPMTAFTELWLLEAERCTGAARKAALRSAKAACAKALACSQKSAVPWHPESLRLHGTVAWLYGAKSTAIRRWHQSIELAQRMNLPPQRARALLEMGDRTNDESLVEEARSVFESIGAKVDLAFSLHVLARMAASAGTTDVALRRYAEAIAALEAVKADDAFRLASRERERLLVACGQCEDARAEQNAG